MIAYSKSIERWRQTGYDDYAKNEERLRVKWQGWVDALDGVIASEQARIVASEALDVAQFGQLLAGPTMKQSGE
jgi:hypothetical protein